MRLFWLALLLSLPAFASFDPSVKTFTTVTGIAPNDGGMMRCAEGSPTPPCVWNSNQTGVVGTSGPVFELFFCTGTFVSGSWQCTGSIVCITCAASGSNNLDVSLFGAAAANTVMKGFPSFDQSGNLLFGASHPGYAAAACQPLYNSPGNGICDDLYAATINASTGALSNVTNLTNIPNGTNGVLYGRTGGGILWLAYNGGGVSTGACALGAMYMRAYTYTPGPSFAVSEITSTATASKAAYSCNYMEASGFYDSITGRFVFQAATGTQFWQTSLLAINAPLTGSATIDVVVASTTGGCNDWDEHGATDPAQAWLYYSTSHFATVVSAQTGQPYNPCATTFVTVPLDRAKATLMRQNGHLTSDYQHAVLLTPFNIIGSAERAAVCAVLNCTSISFVSGGFGQMIGYYQGALQGVSLVKNNAGNGIAYSSAYVNTSRLLGAASLLHAGSIKN